MRLFHAEARGSIPYRLQTRPKLDKKGFVTTEEPRLRSDVSARYNLTLSCDLSKQGTNPFQAFIQLCNRTDSSVLAPGHTRAQTTLPMGNLLP